MIDYFELYKSCLEVIAENHPEQTSDFLKLMNDEPIIKSELDKGTSKHLLIQMIFEVIDNLIEDGLIKATKHKTKVNGTIYVFHGLSTTGIYYLASLKKPTLKEKLITTFKEEGIPSTPTNITKFVAKIIF